MSDNPTTTLRDKYCHGATITFGAWCEILDRLASAVADDPYGPGSATVNAGEDAWWPYYEMGYSPEDALAEDQSYD